METNRAHEIIVEVLQNALTGKLSGNVNLHNIADAIATKVQFEKSYTNAINDKAVGQLVDVIVEKSNEMNEELKNLSSDQTLLKNFIQGKLTAYAEILAATNSL